MIRRHLKDAPSFRSMSEFVPERSPDALLPWGDPYILKLAQQLEREAREQIETAFRNEDEFGRGSFRDDPRGALTHRGGWNSRSSVR
jgi:hypothetical protein